MQQWQPDQGQQIGNVRFTGAKIVLDPFHQSVENVLLRRHIQIVTFQQIRQLFGAQLIEFRVLAHLHEFVVRKSACAFQQRRTTLLFGKQREAQTIGSVQLFAEKCATCANDSGQL